MRRMFLAGLWVAGCSENGFADLKDKDVTEDGSEEVEETTDEVDTETDPGSDTEPDTEAPTEPGTDVDTEPDTEAPTEPATEPDTDVATEPDTDVATEPDSDTLPGGANPCGDPTISPYFAGEIAGGFQSTPGTGYQSTITVTIPCVATEVWAEIIDPDYSNNQMIAYYQGSVVGTAGFAYDGLPGVITFETASIQAAAIDEIELVPDPLDYVAYNLVLYYQ
jgi:hypothetical protein